jgi:hypothetical protein
MHSGRAVGIVCTGARIRAKWVLDYSAGGRIREELVRGNWWGKEETDKGANEKQTPKPGGKEDNVDQELKGGGAEHEACMDLRISREVAGPVSTLISPSY